MPWECRPVVQNLRNVRREVVDSFTAWRGDSRQGEVVVVRTGIGPDLARRAAATLASETEFDLIVSTGCAGGLSSHCEVGDLAVATICHDAHTQLAVSADRRVSHALAQLAATLPVAVHRGPMLCVRQPLTTVEAKRRACADGFIAVEMESAPIGAWAASQKRRYVAVRSILDDADTELVDTGSMDAATGRVRPIGLVRYLAGNPAAVPQLLSMRRSAARAEDTLRRLFHAWLTLPGNEFP